MHTLITLPVSMEAWIYKWKWISNTQTKFLYICSWCYL